LLLEKYQLVTPMDVVCTLSLIPKELKFKLNQLLLILRLREPTQTRFKLKFSGWPKLTTRTLEAHQCYLTTWDGT
jgi:hypothetical protein